MFDDFHELQKSTKRVLNANINTTNILSYVDWIDLCELTLNTIIGVVEPLCGPEAVNSMVIYSSGGSRFNIYSNDGIHITKSIEFASPIQEYIADTLVYIGERVEKASSDGTSTAILCTAYLLLGLQKRIKDIILDKYKKSKDNTEFVKSVQYLLNLYSDDLKLILTKIKKELLSFKIDLNKVNDKNYSELIYNLAYITSKGNKKLSSYIKEIYKNRDIPVQKFSHYLYMRNQIESKSDIDLLIPEEDVRISVFENKNIGYNYKLNTALKYDDCNVIIIPGIISEDRIEFLKSLDKYLNSATKPIIAVSLGFDPNILARMEKSFKDLPFVHCQYVNLNDRFKQNPLELNSILYRAGLNGYNISKNKPADFSDITFEGVKCIIDGGELFIYDENNKYFSNKENSILSEAYKNDDPKYKKYSELLKNIEEQIDIIKKSHVMKDKNSDFREFSRIYKNMICNKLPTIKIGGKTNDHLYLINVIEDVLGTINSALNDGVIIDGILKILYLLHIEKESVIANFNIEEITNFIIDAFLKFYKLNHKNYLDYDKILKEMDDKSSFLKNCFISYNHTKNRKLSVFNNKNDDTYEPIVVQSYKTYDELLDRMIEVLPKIIKTLNIIVPGEVFLKQALGEK